MLTPRGYIKDVDGLKRMRFVREGYDADAEDVPSNQVIFDSRDIGNLSIYAYGDWESSDLSSTGVVLNNLKVITWGALPYVPLVSIQIRTANTPSDPWIGWAHAMTGIDPRTFRMHAYTDGISLFYERFFSFYPRKLNIKWQAYRFPT